eukprot:3464182-Pyramimonas_sp.AAC.1
MTDAPAPPGQRRGSWSERSAVYRLGRRAFSHRCSPGQSLPDTVTETCVHCGCWLHPPAHIV